MIGQLTIEEKKAAAIRALKAAAESMNALEVNQQDYFEICELWAHAEFVAHSDSIPQEIKDLAFRLWDEMPKFYCPELIRLRDSL